VVLHVAELPVRKTIHSFLTDLEHPSRAEFIDAFDDFSSGGDVDVRIRLKTGGWDEICRSFGSSEIDPVEDFLGLRGSLQPFLNYYSRDGGVLELDDDYHAVFFYWAPVRRDLYRQRLVREASLLRLKIRLEREIVRYISLVATLDLSRKADEEAAGEALAAHGFPPFDSGLLAAPRYTEASDLERLCTNGPRVSYDYILSLRERDLVEAARGLRVAAILKMEARLADVEKLLLERPFAGASVWAAEIAAVASAVCLGEATRWRF
jgi:hypothetical protein